MKGHNWIVLLISYASFVVLGLFDGLLGVAWPSMRAAFSQPVDALGMLLAMAMTGHIIASFINGKFITRKGLASLLICSAAMLALGGTTKLLAPVWPLVLAGGLVIGTGMGFLDAGMNTYAASHFRPRLINWLHASFGLGTSLGALLMTGYLKLNGDWMWGIGTLVLLYVGLLALFAFTCKLWVYQPEVAQQVVYAKSRETLKLPLVWNSIAVFFLYTGIEAGIGFWAFTLLTEGRGISEGTAGMWTAFYWGSFMVGRIIFGFVETGLTRLIRFSLILTVVGIFILANADDSVWSLIGLIVTGFSIAPVFPGLVALTPERVGKKHAPNAIGYQIGAAGLAGAAIPGVAGVMGDTWGLNIMPWFFLSVAGLIIALHELLVFTSRRQKPEQYSLGDVLVKEG